jgi:chromosome segregation ATPase
MARKLGIALLSAALISGVINVSPAAAAKISNGTACSKSGATTTVSGFKYRCAKNTMVKNSKLTWLSTDCLSAITQYNSAVRARNSVANSSEQVEQLNIEYEKAVTALASVTAAYDNARAQVTKSQAAMNAATVASEKQALATALSKLANAVLVLSGSKSKLSAQVKDLEAKRELISSAPETFKESVAEAKGSASLLCKKGF